jgi:hypothetical protein
MQRSKQQALMFLLGAVLVGGVVGFSAERVFQHDRFAAGYGPRARFYDELGLTEKQRGQMDSLAAVNDCNVRAVLKPLKPQLDSIRARFNQETQNVFSAEQRAQYDARKKEIQARREAQAAKEPKKQCQN